MKYQLLRDSDKETSYILFSLGLINYFFKFIFTIYFTHHLTPRSYGDFSIALTLLAITANFALMGTSNLSVKFLPRYLLLKDSQILQNFLHWIFKVGFMSCLCIAFLLMAAMLYIHFIGIKGLHSYDILIFVLWVTPFASFALLLENFILGSNHPIISYVLQYNFTRLLQFILFFITISIFQIKFSNLMFTVILILCYLILIIIGLCFLRTKNRKIFDLGHI